MEGARYQGQPARRQPKRVAALLPLLFVLATGGHSARASDIPPAPLSFDWPVPAAVTVTQKTLKKGRRGAARYVVRTVPGPGADQITVSFTDMDVTALEGHDLSDPAVRQQLAPVIAVMAAMPGFIVSRQGELVRVDGVAAMIDKMIEAGVIPAEAVQAMKSPAMQNALANKVGDNWNLWVGAWVGAELSKGDDIAFVAEVPVGDVTVPQSTRMEHLGEPEGYPGHIHLRMTSTLEGPEFQAAMKGFIEQMLANMPKAKNAPEGLPEMNLRRTGVIEVYTDPRTLRPAYAMSDMRVTAEASGQVPLDRHDRQEFHFSWSKH